jgi:hypothetical protein
MRSFDKAHWTRTCETVDGGDRHTRVSCAFAPAWIDGTHNSARGQVRDLLEVPAQLTTVEVYRAARRQGERAHVGGCGRDARHVVLTSCGIQTVRAAKARRLIAEQMRARRTHRLGGDPAGNAPLAVCTVHEAHRKPQDGKQEDICRQRSLSCTYTYMELC